MDGLQKKIAGDWFDLREHAEKAYDIEELFAPAGSDLKELIQDIRLSVEDGIVEYKRKVLLPLFSFLESLKYDSRGLEQLTAQAVKLSPLIYTILLQRLLCRGTITLRREKVVVETEENRDIKEIVQDINSRIKENPAMGQHPAVKNIFMQMNIYKRELEDMKKLSPNIPPDKASSFFANFKNRFDEITRSIRENYASIEREEKTRQKESLQSSPLAAYELSPLAKLCADQAQQAAKIRSTLAFAEKEGFKTREYLVRLGQEKEMVLKPFTGEAQYLGRLETTRAKVSALAKLLGGELIFILEKQVKRLEAGG